MLHIQINFTFPVWDSAGLHHVLGFVIQVMFASREQIIYIIVLGVLLINGVSWVFQDHVLQIQENLHQPIGHSTCVHAIKATMGTPAGAQTCHYFQVKALPQ
jgi:hypothetical protein